MYEFLEKRYALALYEIAEENNKVEEFIEDLKEVNEIISSNKEFIAILENPNVSKKRKKELIKEIFDGKTSKEIISFLCILVDKDRILSLKNIVQKIDSIYLGKHNILEVTAISAIPLTSEELSKLKEKLERKYRKEVIIEAKIDESIIGGLLIKVDNEIIDGTLAKKYKELKDLMINTK